MREMVAAVWAVFSVDGRSVTKEDFLRPAEGLCDSIIAGLNLAQG